MTSNLESRNLANDAVTSFDGSYTLSASATNVTAPGGWTVTVNETASSNNLSLALLPCAGLASICSQAFAQGWRSELAR